IGLYKNSASVVICVEFARLLRAVFAGESND
ncbi:unnamed protein product, partial [Rotaria sp. Silwood1]